MAPRRHCQVLQVLGSVLGARNRQQSGVASDFLRGKDGGHQRGGIVRLVVGGWDLASACERRPSPEFAGRGCSGVRPRARRYRNGCWSSPAAGGTATGWEYPVAGDRWCLGAARSGRSSAAQLKIPRWRATSSRCGRGQARGQGRTPGGVCRCSTGRRLADSLRRCAEERIASVGAVELLLNERPQDRKALVGQVTGDARLAVGAEARAEERVGVIDAARIVSGVAESAR
jgi:hypothetical protein